MRVSRIIMGTGVSIDIPGAKEVIFEKVFARLREIDSQFSTYKPESEVSRYGRGEIAEPNVSRDLKAIIKACKAAEQATQGFFSAWATGSFDPSGYVKGWAINEAAKIIKKGGYNTFCIAIGGDILAASDSDKVWKIGIQNPQNRGAILAGVAVKNMAIATSGNYERGLHIVSPKTGKPADSILSISVVGPDIINADVLATTAFVQGKFGLNFVGGQARGYEAYAVDKTGKISMTAGMQALLA